MTQSDVQTLADGLDSIRRIVDYWREFDAKSRASEGLETTPDTHIMSPPSWPSHGQLKAWSECLAASYARLSNNKNGE